MSDDPVTKVEVIRNQDDPNSYLLTIEIEGADITKEAALEIARARLARLRRLGVRLNSVVITENARRQ